MRSCSYKCVRVIAGMVANHLPFSCLGRGGPRKGTGVHSQGAAHPCAGPGLLVPLRQRLRGSVPLACKPRDGSQQDKASVKGAGVAPAERPMVSVLASGSPRVKDVGTHCLKSIGSFPLKHLGVNLLPPPLWFWGLWKTQCPLPKVIRCVVHESASLQSLLR